MRPLAGISLIGVLCTAWAASAQALPARAARTREKPAKNSEADPAVRSLFIEASKEYDLGLLREALAKFQEVYKQSPQPIVLFNIAQCHRQLKEWERAAYSYRAFLRVAGSSPRVADAERLLAEVTQKLEEANRAESQRAKAAAAAVVAGAPTAEDAKQTKNAPAASAPAPGSAVAPATGSGALGASASGPRGTAPAPSTSRGPSALRVAAWAAGGVGVLSLAGGGLRFSSGLGQFSDARRAYEANGYYRGSDLAALDSGRSALSQGRVLVGAGAGLAILSALILIIAE